MDIYDNENKKSVTVESLRVFINVLDLKSLSRVHNFAEIDDELLDHIRHCVLCILRRTVSTISFVFGI